jgi:hypothetical protein
MNACDRAILTLLNEFARETGEDPYWSDEAFARWAVSHGYVTIVATEAEWCVITLTTEGKRRAGALTTRVG